MAHESTKLKLEERLHGLQSRLLKLKIDATQSHSGDSAEQAQERENDEVVDALGQETTRSIALISAALARIEGGTYGVCESCGEPIEKARLGAMPEALRCLGCAN